MEYTRAVEIARGLLGDGQGGEVGQNPEYERGILEFILDAVSVPGTEAEHPRERLARDLGILHPAEQEDEDAVYDALSALEQVLHDHGLPLDETIEVFAALARSSVRAIADPASQHLAYQVDLRRENARALEGRPTRCPICSSELP